MSAITSALRRAILACGFVFAASPSLAAGPVIDSAPEDPKLGRAAYFALQRDAVLADLNLGVRVMKDGTAVLWGSEVSAATLARVEAVLKAVPGVRGVVNQGDAKAARDPFVARVEAAFKSPAPADPVVERVEISPTPPAPVAAVSRQTTTVEKPPVDLLPSSRVPVRDSTARLLAPQPVAAVDYSAIEKARRADPRYAGLTLETRDGRVVIGGAAADPSAAWDLAKALAPLVGDRDVVVGRVRLR